MEHTIYLIHGFNVRDDGASSVDSIRPYFEDLGYSVIDIDYGFFLRTRVRLCNKGVAKAISSLVEPGSTCIAHSNGGAIAYQACEFGAPFKNVILVNPALDSDLAIAKHIKNIQVWYSPKDKWTGIAKYIPFSPWGAQGRTGYTGPPDDRYTMYNEDSLLEKTKDEHSGIFHTPGNLKYFANEVAKLIGD